MRRVNHRTTVAVAALLAAVTVTRAQPTLVADDVTLSFVGDAQGGYRPQFKNADATFTAPAAATLFILPPDGDETTRRIDLAAQSVTTTGETVRTQATHRTGSGTTLQVDDEWSGQPGSPGTFRLRRTIKVIADGPDRAFGSGVEIGSPTSLRSLADADVFIPGLWYGTQANTRPSSLIHDVGQSDFLLREDRMPLPIVSLRDRATGQTITLTHETPDGGTIRADDTLRRLVDARLKFASLGLRREADALRVAFRFPGTEGEQTSIFGFKPERRTVERLTPITAGASQTYSLAVRISRAPDFTSQMRDAWRDAFTRAQPEVVTIDAAAVHKASVGVLSHYAYTRGNVSGIPFSAELPAGTVRDFSLQMGFVGQQLPCASYLIEEGLRTKNAKLIGQGERIVDFWSRECLAPSGMPRMWFNVDPQPHWRRTNTFLRSATDGTSGMLRAWRIERAAGRSKPQWLAFCTKIGDWLLKHQAADGSFPREFNFDDGRPASDSKTSTLHPVRLLIDLTCATGDAKYRDAAIRAGEWSLANNADGRTYVGGTPDNPDVIDKEAGWIALDSYLALYDVTQDKRWLDAAVAAATFTETWVYGWNVPMPVDAQRRRLTLPRIKTTAGMSLIATGHSGSDLFLSYAWLSYIRLSLYTRDPHFADVARLLQANPAQLVSVNGSLRYAQDGLCLEAFSLAVNRGHSVNVWLPWCTSAILEPMARSRETFGTIDATEVLKLDPADRERRHAAWAKTRGFEAR